MASQPVTARTSLSQWPAAKRKATLIPMLMSSVMILVLVLANMSYLFGTTIGQGKRSHALKILAVDFDEGAIGAAVATASRSLQAPNFPTIEFGSASKYATTESVKNAVCKGDYWAAIYVPSGASTKLANAINGTSTGYNAADSIVYTYNQARYPAQADSILLSGIQKVVGVARGSYYQTPNGIAALTSLNASNPAGVTAYLNPIQSTPDLIQPTTQGSRVLFNTVNIIIPTLAQFFYILALNGIGLSSGFLSGVRVRDVWLFRFGIGKIYGFLTALTVTGYLWAFRENWDVGSFEFGKTLLVFWLYMDVQWQVLESLIGSFVPMQFMPFFFLTWIIMNIASTIAPFELMPGFYRIGYAMPAHEAYSMMVLAWSGCADQTRVALPVLFAWWLVGHVGSVFSIRKRCADAGQAAAAAATRAQEDDDVTRQRPHSSDLTLRSDEEQLRNEK
ncbi:nitrosoguanidine resistance protein [Colletotrichum truncatum]|uniref:Nitrosoguanidine resistance protein n=1 Tax=Colletotrichum truncatum TaxID=5467 RepID=A0ACC3ZFM8_COLTU|nr:nitrosoguanidine resistance protein [Colletotrichum truncatum]KAF6801621.1 nitrosoguanidine resistance protein [Colletotrichum truncatum]